MSELAVPEAAPLARLEELELERRKADARFDVARRAKLSDEELLPFARARLDAWREWGIELGEPTTGRPPGNVTDGHISEPERKARERARRIAAVPADEFEAYKAQVDPDELTLAGLYATSPKGFTGYSSATDLWATPHDLFQELNAEFCFTLDVCATAENAKCDRFFTEQEDGLEQDWSGVCWMNPPYGDAIATWVKKAYESAEDGAIVVCLVPARVDTGWWWDYCRHGDVRFLRGRLKFGGGENSAPFPSAVVVFPGTADTIYWERAA
jgi:phage N-6-adenine-methyltransferase